MQSPTTTALLLTAALLPSQPTAERPLDLSSRLAAVGDGPRAARLEALRRLGLHRHLMARPNVDRVRAIVCGLVDGGEGELAHAAAAVAYLTEGRGFEVRGRRSWQRAWRLGLEPELEPSGEAELRAGLTHGEPTVRMWASLALARQRPTDEAVVPSLLAVLRGGTPDQRALAARLLGSRHRALPEILTALAAAPAALRPWFVRPVVAFAKVDPDEFDAAVPHLRGAFEGTAADLRFTVAEALAQRRQLTAGRVAVLLELLGEIGDVSRDTFAWYPGHRIRRRVAERLVSAEVGFEAEIVAGVDRMLGDGAHDEALFVLIDGLGPRARGLEATLVRELGKERRDADEIAAALGRIGPLTDRTLRQLAGQLDQEREFVRRACAISLASAGTRAAPFARALLGRLDAGDASVAEGAGRLAAVSDPALDLLVRTPPPAGESARGARAAALGWSGRRRDPRVVRWLVDALDSGGNPGNRYPVIQAVQRLGATDPRLVAALVALLPEQTRDTGLYAARCLAELRCARERTIPALRGFLRSESVFDSKRNVAARGLVRFPGLDPEIITEIASHLRRKRVVFGRESGWFFQESIALALGELGSAGAPAVPELLAALRSSDQLGHTGVRTAIECLGRISVAPGDVIPLLLDHVGENAYLSDPARRAIAGYGRQAVPVLEALAAGEAPRAIRARELLAGLR